MSTPKEIAELIAGNKNMGIKDIQANAASLHAAGERVVECGEEILDAKGNPTGLYTYDPRVRVLINEKTKRRIVTFKLLK